MQQLLIVVVRKLLFFHRERERGKKKWERKNQLQLMNFILDVLKRRITKSVKRERERERHTHTHTHRETERELKLPNNSKLLFFTEAFRGFFFPSCKKKRKTIKHKNKKKVKTLIEKGISFLCFLSCEQ
jgi:hypothetical protein